METLQNMAAHDCDLELHDLSLAPAPPSPSSIFQIGHPRPDNPAQHEAPKESHENP